MHYITVHRLALLVQQLNAYLAPQVGKRGRRMPLVQLLRRVGPGDEIVVLSEATLERDRLVLGTAQRFEDDVVAALTVLDDIRRSFQRADLTDRGDGARA